MASSQVHPPLNGGDAAAGQAGINDFDPDDPECQRQMMRPPVIEQDMKEMDRRRRVDVILNSQVFREELERIIESQLNDGYLPASLSALQQVTELLLPHSGRNSSMGKLGGAGPPVNDIRGIDGLKYAKGEKLLRCKLASVYRLVELYGWTMGIYNHITVRVSQDQEHFLLNPFGLQYHEVTASSLIKVDMQGNVIDPGSTNFTFNKAGFMLHSSIHSSRPDIKAILHLHYPPCVAVSAMKQGLLLACQEAAILGPVSYHDYQGMLVNPAERELIARNLGPNNKVLILRNHGVVTCGETLEEALFLMTNLVLACETQIRLAQVGLENVRLLPDETVEQVRSIIRDAGAATQGLAKGELDDSLEKQQQNAKQQQSSGGSKKWKIWDLEFEAQMRMLDNAGFRTGYIYRQPLLRAESTRARSDVEVPPTASSHGNAYDEDKWLSPLRKLVQGKKTQDKLNWVNSPNVYQKVEILETGTTDPKKITKWQINQDGTTPTHSTPIKIDSHTQFVPINGGDPNEFKRRQREMKEVRMKNMITSGPQSHILEGVNWDEARQHVANASQLDGTVPGNHVVMVGAASKGIIQRDFQHNATVYKSAYAKNPFDNVTEEELKEYRSLIERKQRGEHVPDDQIPENMKHLLAEPINLHQQDSQDIASPTSPTSPLSDDEADGNVNGEHDKHDRSSKEGSPVKDDKKSKDKEKKEKKKGGIRTSFFSKKKSKTKEKDEAQAVAASN